jgi:hypothetical protein
MLNAFLHLFPGLDFFPVAHAAIALSGQIFALLVSDFPSLLPFPDGKLTFS